MNINNEIYYDDFILVDQVLPILIKNTGIRVYDFDFRRFFNIKSIHVTNNNLVVARLGGIVDYEKDFNILSDYGINLIHSPPEHETCSKLQNWYPLICDMTPKSIVFDELPSIKDIENNFNWPIFVKGERQTSKHKKSLSIIDSQSQFEELKKIWLKDPILSWQKMVCRQFVQLKKVEESLYDCIDCSYEFRLFFWKNNFIGLGRYWFENKNYDICNEDRAKIINIGTEVAKRINVTFVAVDIALTELGDWIVIEINDGQESGLVGCNPYVLWSNIIEIEKGL